MQSVADTYLLNYRESDMTNGICMVEYVYLLCVWPACQKGEDSSLNK